MWLYKGWICRISGHWKWWSTIKFKRTLIPYFQIANGTWYNMIHHDTKQTDPSFLPCRLSCGNRVRTISCCFFRNRTSVPGGVEEDQIRAVFSCIFVQLLPDGKGWKWNADDSAAEIACPDLPCPGVQKVSPIAISWLDGGSKDTLR